MNPKVFAEACKELLGQHSCYVMYSAGTMQLKESFKNTCRAYNISPSEANEVSKDIEFYENDPKWKDIIQLSKSMVGTIASISPNPCGYLIMNDDIRRKIGVVRVGDELCCLIDKNTADEWKYLKNDFLKVEVWEIISEVYKELGKPIDDIFTLNKLTKDNDNVWRLYEDGITATLNQTSTNFAKPLVMRYKPKNVDELTAFVAGIRPSFGSMMDYLLDRKPFSYNIPEFDKLLQSSMNFVLYQENIMATLVFAGFPEDETYGLIKAISKKKEHIVKGIRDRFIDGFVSKTGSEENALKVWQIIEDASAYGFNSSHALAVAYDSLYGAYLKATYPLEYYKVVLNLSVSDKEMTQKLTQELEYFKIKISDPKFGYSKSEYNIDYKNNTIYKGITSIPYMNEVVGVELFNLYKQDKPVNAVDLFVKLAESTSCNSRQAEILIKIGFFEEYGKSKYLLDLYNRFKVRFKKTHKEATKQARIKEIYEFSQTLSHDDLTAGEIVMAQMEYMGYVSYSNKEMASDIGVIVGLTEQYANRWATIYYPYHAKRLLLKIHRDLIQEYDLKVGTMLRVDKIEYNFKRKKNADGSWGVSDEKEPHIKLLTIFK